MATRGARVARVAVLSILTYACGGCAARTMANVDRDSTARYLTFRNMTEDEVRVYVYEGDRGWLIGNVQGFRSARLLIPTDLVMRRGEVVSVAAVPLGGRGPDGNYTTGTIVRSDGELIEHVAEFQWALTGHTLTAEPRRRR
jgi:hypothetical protein